jgi:hypothetical protein
VILAAHSVLATLTTVRELELTEEEARKLADASKEVLRHYPLGLSDKTLAWVNLSLVGANVYGPRAMAWGIRRAGERRPKMQAPASGPSGPAAAPVKPRPVNGQPGLDLTPAFMTAPPEHEDVP